MPRTSFHSYSRETPAAPPAPEKIPSWQAWKTDPTPENFQSMVAENQGAIDAAIRNSGGDVSDLRIPAMKLLKRAAETYDPSGGAAFGTHAHNWLKGLNRTRWDREFVLHVPERSRTRQSRISEFKKQFEADTGREPEDDEIFESLGITERQMRRASRSSLETSGSASESGFGGQLVAQKGETDRDMLLEALYEDAAADEDRLGQSILRNHFGYLDGKKMTQTEIARTHGVSPAAVNKRIKKLKEELGDW